MAELDRALKSLDDRAKMQTANVSHVFDGYRLMCETLARQLANQEVRIIEVNAINADLLEACEVALEWILETVVDYGLHRSERPNIEMVTGAIAKARDA